MTENKKEFRKRDLGDGLFIRYQMDENGLGGYHPVSIALCRDDGTCIRQLTGKSGEFLDTPKVLRGGWCEKVEHVVYRATLYNVNISDYVDGACCFCWEIQPDGRYWADEDGFGMENEEEIWLYALLDREGQFITGFSDKYEEKYGKRMNGLW